jgi:hypothetical protein
MIHYIFLIFILFIFLYSQTVFTFWTTVVSWGSCPAPLFVNLLWPLNFNNHVCSRIYNDSIRISLALLSIYFEIFFPFISYSPSNVLLNGIHVSASYSRWDFSEVRSVQLQRIKHYKIWNVVNLLLLRNFISDLFELRQLMWSRTVGDHIPLNTLIITKHLSIRLIPVRTVLFVRWSGGNTVITTHKR